ncbi:MAG: hypothetical protein QOH36_1280 [Actinomycetota bacterium]|nr:hypothetical protein [Actinomycetota bacterium]
MVRSASNGGAELTMPGERDLRIAVLGDAAVWLGDDRLAFPTHRAELAMFALALAGPAGLHQEVLLERLWPEAPADRGLARLRTLLWQVRRALGPEAWRVQRRGRQLLLVLDGARVDLAEARDAAERLLGTELIDLPAARTVLTALIQPLLAAWPFEPWVDAERERNAELVVALQQQVAREH